MNLDEIRQTLETATLVKLPRFAPDAHPSVKIEGLESHIAATAYHRADLERALYWLWEADKALRDQWDDIAGWEPHARARKTGKDVTQEDIRQAKRTLEPGLFDGLRECARLKEHLGRQIRRLEKDYDAASRIYTLITGK